MYRLLAGHFTFYTVRVVFSKNTPCLAHDSKVGFGINRGG